MQMKTINEKAVLLIKMFMCYAAFWVISVSYQMLELYVFWSEYLGK